MMGTRVGDEFKWMSWTQCWERSSHISFGIKALDLAPDISAEDSTFRFIGIQSKNRADWVITHLANMQQSITTVAFFDTLGPDAQKFIINQTEMTTMVVSYDYLNKFAKTTIEDRTGDNKLQTLKNIVVFENEILDEDRKLCEEAGLNVYTLEELYQKGVEAVKAGTATSDEPKPETCSAFSYTSGTTGDPKGVKLTHKMLVQSAYAVAVRQ